MSLLIKNGTVVTAADFHRADVLIEGEHVKAIGHDLHAPDAEVIDAKGMFVLPGGIDPHVHLDMPFMGTFSSDNYETGTLAALHGGTTTVIDFILQTQGKSLRHALEQFQFAPTRPASPTISPRRTEKFSRSPGWAGTTRSCTSSIFLRRPRDWR